ncbi:hypothetical protein BDR26DRAFT_528648 [Obelidium mucronatum]|nr:hypothetical protein BDR26DRAFT_528648 [Obelidium mucronatum]
MTIIMCHYLGVTLPFQIVYSGGSKSHMKTSGRSMEWIVGDSDDTLIPGQMPLFLSDSNLDSFTVGLTMLNYDIAYLCWTQGVRVPLHQGANTLENLAACCRATKLGRDVNQRLDSISPGSTSPTSSPRLKNKAQVSSPDAPSQIWAEFSLPFRKLHSLHIALQKRDKPTSSAPGAASSSALKSNSRRFSGTTQKTNSSLPASKQQTKHQQQQQPQNGSVLQQQQHQHDNQTQSPSYPSAFTSAVVWAASGVANAGLKHGLGAVKAASAVVSHAVSGAATSISSAAAAGNNGSTLVSSFLSSTTIAGSRSGNQQSTHQQQQQQQEDSTPPVRGIVEFEEDDDDDDDGFGVAGVGGGSSRGSIGGGVLIEKESGIDAGLLAIATVLDSAENNASEDESEEWDDGFLKL